MAETKTAKNVYEFPVETMALIQKHAKHFGVNPEDAISKAIGLLECWVNADRKKRVFIERPEGRDLVKGECKIVVQ